MLIKENKKYISKAGKTQVEIVAIETSVMEPHIKLIIYKYNNRTCSCISETDFKLQFEEINEGILKIKANYEKKKLPST